LKLEGLPGLWKENLSSIDSLLKKKQFRHEQSAVSASSIGTQFFCEMKVEQDFIHGEIETEEKTEGDILHRELLAMKPTTRKRILREIEEKRLVVASFPLAGEADGLVLIGVPDAVVFQEGRPTYLIELKTTRGDPSILFDGQRAQAVVYGLLLDEVGFDCSKLNLVVIKFRRMNPMQDEQKARFLDLLTRTLASGEKPDKLASGAGGHLVTHSFSYQRSEASRILTLTRGYWLEQRLPQPTSNPNKCRACEFRSVCPSSLYDSVNVHQ
jgi:CRISPR/Cas system-associated exonuclease Cas4 (RecB family)